MATLNKHESQLADGLDNPLIGARQAAVADVTGTPDATYSANEQTILSDLITAVNAVITVLEAHGLVASND